METFDNIVSVTSVDSTSTSIKTNFVNMVTSLLASMCRTVQFGENATVAKSQLSVLQSYKYDLANTTNGSLDLSCKNCGKIQNAAMLLFGDDLASKYRSWQCTADYPCTGKCSWYFIAAATLNDRDKFREPSFSL